MVGFTRILDLAFELWDFCGCSWLQFFLVTGGLLKQGLPHFSRAQEQPVVSG